MDAHRKKKKRVADDGCFIRDDLCGCYFHSDSDSDDGHAIKRRRRERRLPVDEERVFSSAVRRKIKLGEEHQEDKRRELSIRIVSFEEHTKGGRMRYCKKKSVSQQQPIDELRMRPDNGASEFVELEKTLWEELEEKPTESLKEIFRSKLMEVRKRRESGISEDLYVALPKCMSKLKIEEADEDLRMCLAKLKIEETDEDLWKSLAELKIQETDDDLRKGVEKLKRIAKQRQQSDNLEKIVTILCQIEKENSFGLLTLRSLANYFIDLKWRLSHDYTLYDLSSFAYTFALPFFMRVFQHWNPLLKPSHKLNVVSMWKDLLQSEDGIAYPKLVSEVILPAERISHFLNGWNARNPQQMLSFLEAWESLLPSSILDTILDSIVMPKLLGLSGEWVRPWLPLLEYKREDLYKRISKQLG